MTTGSTNKQNADITCRLEQLNKDLSFFSGIRRGIEKESVRSSSGGQMSQVSHPSALGAPLTHPHITTDFAEAQLEFVTPAFKSSEEAIRFLSTLHCYTAQNLPDGEFLWGASMPPVLPAEDQVHLAQYGSSNAAKLKTLYRTGLANRYGKAMQTISGIHYNFSLPDSFWEALHAVDGSSLPLQKYKSEGYFSLIRNVMRHGWIINYLFGASPAIDTSFVDGRMHHLHKLTDDTLYLPWATSLRMSDLGYTSNAQSSLNIRYNSQEQYLADLSYALSLASEDYNHFDASQQINSHVLQLENELYGSIRPKRIHQTLRPMHAICAEGVEYIELRSLDINPYQPLGLDRETSCFLDMFLVYCALATSPEISYQEQVLINQRQQLVATEGRKPGLKLPMLNGDQPLMEVGLQIITAMEPLAQCLDQRLDQMMSCHDFTGALKSQSEKFINSGLTPSAKMLTDLRYRQCSYRELIMDLSREHMGVFRETLIEESLEGHLKEMVSRSREQQQQIEKQDSMTFTEYVAEKNADIECCCEHAVVREAC